MRSWSNLPSKTLGHRCFQGPTPGRLRQYLTKRPESDVPLRAAADPWGEPPYLDLISMWSANEGYPLVNEQKYGKSLFSNRELNYKWAILNSQMLNYQRVVTIIVDQTQLLDTTFQLSSCTQIQRRNKSWSQLKSDGCGNTQIQNAFPMVSKFGGFITHNCHMLHYASIFTYIWRIFRANVCKYIFHTYMEHMGFFRNWQKYFPVETMDQIRGFVAKNFPSCQCCMTNLGAGYASNQPTLLYPLFHVYYMLSHQQLLDCLIRK